MNKGTQAFLVSLVLGSFALCAQDTDKEKVDKMLARKDSPSCELRVAMNKLWDDHTFYTHQYIVSAIAGLPDAEAVSKRLLKNQDDIGTAIRPYYGADAEKKLASLLRDHILIAVDVVNAAKADEKERLTQQQKRWTENGKEIAAFLSSANPAWPRKKMESMLQSHLDMVTTQVTARLKKDWAGDIKNSDEGRDHMLEFADLLTEGIVKQFPSKFKD